MSINYPPQATPLPSGRWRQGAPFTPRGIVSGHNGDGTRQSLRVNASGPQTRQHLISTLLVLSYATYAFTWPFSRSLGTAPFSAIIIASAAYCLIYRRWVLGPFYIALLLTYLIYCSLSFSNILPLSWTDARYPEIIPQQLTPYVALPLVCAPMFDAFCTWRSDGRLKRYITWALVVSWLGMSWFKGQELGILTVYTRITDLSNVMIFRIVCIFFLLSEQPISLRRATLLVGILAVFCDDSQTKVSLLIAAGMLFLPAKRLNAFAAIFALWLAIFLAPHFWSNIWAIDRNSGIRAVFWRDASDAIADSHFLGIGFGTQSVHYSFADFSAFVLQGDRAKLRLIGLHNSFYQAAFRCGVFGLIFIVAWVLWLVQTSRPNKFYVFQLWTIVVVVVSFCTNPSLESVNFLFGNAFALSLTLAMRGAKPKDLSAAPTRWRASQLVPQRKA